MVTNSPLTGIVGLLQGIHLSLSAFDHTHPKRLTLASPIKLQAPTVQAQKPRDIAKA